MAIFGILVRAYTYIRTMGPEGLRKVSESAVLHANYLRKKRLEPYFEAPYSQVCKHEFVFIRIETETAWCKNTRYGKTSA
ncbi:hypothetical protein GCM10020331_002480 [Ectobacillus funiculus]